ncbi:uncharacterized protein LOC110846560 isoform X2 [Folsomia candida]|uniref:uncharacterized protein LOC110846560 isoform X2 n=1 Tax=Folsomia candida TaxID=158441 RepID=UPI0016053232|nr:uncharacterized protein LOC110846560 isoform X2 [Folsomia candida]
MIAEKVSKVLCFLFVIYLSCNSVFADQPESSTHRAVQVRDPKQLSGFFEWLFGPQVTKSTKEVKGIATSPPIIYQQLTRFKDSSHHQPHKKVSTDPPPNHPLDRAEVQVYQPPVVATANETSLSTLEQRNNSFNSNSTQSVLPRPKPRKIRSEPANDFRQIQITDIQHAVGAEINEDDLNSDPAQVNLQEELEAIDRLEKNLTDNSMRAKRDASSSKFRQLNIPYGHDVSSSNRINTLSKRQLLLSPGEQQMFALRQQELAAAAMLQQQPLLSRYNNRYIDDYYDDDSSYEDSDEYYDNFNRNGLHPIMQAMRHGVRIPPIHHPYGIGRRSLPDDQGLAGGHASSSSRAKQGRGNSKLSKTMGVRGDSSYLGPISKAGRWGTIEDYDLSSAPNKLTSRNGMPSRSGGGSRSGESVGEKHKEIFSAAENRRNMAKGRSELLGRQDSQDVNISTTSSPVPADITTTEIPSEGSVTESPTPAATIPDPDETEETPGEHEEQTPISEPTTTPIPSSTDESEEETSTPVSSSSPPTPVSEAPSTQVSEISKPKPTITTTTVKPQPANLPPYHQTLNCRCGMQSVRGHDIGENTIIRAMVNPWLVAVRTKKKHLCSGSIINNKYILTSKSCVKGARGLIATAGIGSGIPKNFSIIHVNEHSTRNIALLRVKPAISPNFAMRPICLPISESSERNINTGTGILVTFKKSSLRGSSGLQLVQTEVPMLSSAKCTNSPGGSAGSRNICPGPPGTMKCGGDSGGILQMYQKGYSYEQIGVVSTTVGCRAHKTPGVYTDLRKSVKWILYNTKDARYCRKPRVTAQDLINTKKTEVESNVSEWEDEEIEDSSDDIEADDEE